MIQSFEVRDLGINLFWGNNTKHGYVVQNSKDHTILVKEEGIETSSEAMEKLLKYVYEHAYREGMVHIGNKC